MIDVHSLIAGRWLAPDDGAREIADAATGRIIARAGHTALDVQAMLDHARDTGGPALRALTFHDRARLLKALALHLEAHKEALYDLSFHTGATRRDHAFDIDGGIGTMFVYASKGRRELPDAHVHLDGGLETLSRDGSFLGRHIHTSLRGVAVQINAYNFPVWGMLEKLAPALLAGMPAIVKPATATSYVTERAIRLMQDSGLLPDGALQMIAGGTGDLLDRLTCQDVLGFTGSAATAATLRANPVLGANAVRFTAEQDSLNATILGPDAGPGSPEFDLFLREVQREMTTKAGQKCTAIRRILVPRAHVEAAIDGLRARLAGTVLGNPRDAATTMGPLVSLAQRRDVLDRLALLGTEAERVIGNPADFAVAGADAEAGAFLPPLLLHCADPDAALHVHQTEAFGPVATLMPYDDLDHAVALANRGGGSLVASLVTHDPAVARHVALGTGAFHGRLYIADRATMASGTGHGAPMPHMVHGGPGRAGGGEELGGVRAVFHHMQRTAVQGSADMLTAVGGTWVPGAAETAGPAHPFTRTYAELAIGETLQTAPRTVTLDDIDHFARFTGDTFYAHTDAEAAARNPFFPGRVRPRLPPAVVRRRPLRRTVGGTGPCQHRPRRPAVPQAGGAGREHRRAPDGEGEDAAHGRVRRGALAGRADRRRRRPGGGVRAADDGGPRPLSSGAPVPNLDR